MMIRFIVYIATITLPMIAFPSVSQAQGITIRLSYKIVLNPADGSRPMIGSRPVADADIDTAIDAMNALYATYFRGYHFRRVDPIIEVGGMGDTTGPSRWFNTDFFNDRGAKDTMEAAAMQDPHYRWNDKAINLYITNGFCGGRCSFPGWPFGIFRDSIIIIGGCTAAGGATQLHEIGHYFSLCHTQGCPCGCCNPMSSGECNTEPGSDGIDDTLPDLPCWNQDNIANRSFGTNYVNLSAAQQNLVDNVFLNIMSYHGTICGTGVTRTRMTELQLDAWADTANGARDHAVSGTTIFVDAKAPAPPPPVLPGSSLFPHKTVQAGISVADESGGDIVLIRPGAYNETLRITKPVTLRATRMGPVVIGTSVAPLPSISPAAREIDAALRKLPGITVDDGSQRTNFAGAGKRPHR